MAIRLFEFDDLKVRSFTHAGQSYFAVKEIGTALQYKDAIQAAKLHVDPEYLTTMAKLNQSAVTANLTGPVVFTGPTETHLLSLEKANSARELWVSEPGLYQLALSSKKAEAVRFKKWCFEELLPTLKQTGSFTVRSNQMSLLNETDLHEAVVRFIRAQYPHTLIVAGLGELQTTDSLRISSWAKGYTSGQPDICLPYRSGKFCGLALELKTPAYFREPAPKQKTFLAALEEAGWDTLVSSNYDECVVKVLRFLDKVVAARKRKRAKSASSETSTL
jgi:prophage antirepressor-like protein